MAAPLSAAEISAMQRRQGELIVEVIKLSFGQTTLATIDGAALWKQIMECLSDASKLSVEVDRLRGQLRSIRDLHSPQNSSDPARPGAVCVACSMGGAWVPWPCATWKASEIPS